MLMVGFAALVLPKVIGCQDHRMPMDEFLAMKASPCPAPTTRPAVAQTSINRAIDETLGPYRVGPGDVLTVSVTVTDLQNQVPTVQTRVNRNGEAEVPLVGAVKVAGLDLEGVEAALHKAYVPRLFRQVVIHVEVANPEPTRVLVTGAVTAPGLIELRRTERNLLFAIVRSGGVSEQASGKATLKRLRNPNQEITFDLTDPTELKKALTFDPLQNGDIVRVQAAIPNTIFVGGLVNAPHPQVYSPGVPVTVLQAIAAASGLRTDVTPKEATLIRRLPDQRDVQVKLDLDRITTGRDPNLTLAAGDILWVPDTVETRVQDWINRNIFFRAGVSVTYNLEGDRNYLHGDSFNSGNTNQNTNPYERFDPFGNLIRNQALQSINNRVSQP